MKVEYTLYAEAKIAKRAIPKVDIESTLESPGKIVDGKDGRQIAQGVLGRHLLRVVFEKNRNQFKVITAYYSEPERYK